MGACTDQADENAIRDARPGWRLSSTVKAKVIIRVALELLKDQVRNSVVVHFNFNKDNLRNSKNNHRSI
jgi:hypothetical protein